MSDKRKANTSTGEVDGVQNFMALSKNLNGPTTFSRAEGWPSQQGLYHHRPPGPPEGRLHVSLYSQAMGQFCADADNTKDLRDQETYDFVKLLCFQMADTYYFQAARRRTFLETFNEYFKKFQCRPIVRERLATDGTIVARSKDNIDVILLNLVVKNEKESANSDCIMENLGYFIKLWGNLKQHKVIGRARSFLVTLEGCILHVFGAVLVNGEVHMDPLCSPFHLLMLVDDVKEMERLASCFWALRQGLPSLLDEFNADIIGDTRFPYLVRLPQSELAWTYIQPLRRRVFLATLDNSDKQVVVKFSPSAHASELQELLAKEGYAPHLHGSVSLAPWWHVSISEFIEATDDSGPFSEGQKEHLKAAVALMHKHGWVHGDLRPRNILRVDENHIRIIDFELCGRENEALYPLFLFQGDDYVNWPQGFAAGKPIMKKHDKEWLRRILNNKI